MYLDYDEYEHFENDYQQQSEEQLMELEIDAFIQESNKNLGRWINYIEPKTLDNFLRDIKTHNWDIKQIELQEEIEMWYLDVRDNLVLDYHLNKEGKIEENK